MSRRRFKLINAGSGGGVTDHTALTNIGTNTHAQIDTHIANGTIHFTQGAISIPLTQISDVTATVGEVNLLDLSGLTAGWVLSADTATTASWKAPSGGGGGTIGGTIANDQIAFGAATADEIEGSSGLTYDGTTFTHTSSSFGVHVIDRTTSVGSVAVRYQTDDGVKGYAGFTDSSEFQTFTSAAGPTGFKVSSAGAITAVTYGGVASGNLTDKSTTESITGLWTFSNANLGSLVVDRVSATLASTIRYDNTDGVKGYAGFDDTGSFITYDNLPVLSGFSVTSAGAVAGTTFNGVALTTGGLATNFLNETGTYTAAGGGGTTVDAGTADGEMLIWDQTTDTAWEPTDFLVANPAAGTLSFKKTGDFTSLVITTADTDGISNVTTFSNGNAEDFMSFRDANSFGLIEVHANDMRFEANDISSNGSNRITFISTGGGRAEIYLTNANALRLDNSTGAFTHVESVEPIGVLTTTKPVSSIEGFLFWQETANTAGCGYVMNDQAKSHPIGNMQHLNYRWNSPNTAADPGPGFFRLDAAGGWTSTTELYFADEDYGDQDSGLWFSFLAVGDCLRIMDSTDHSRWAAMEVTSITDNTGWWTVGVNMLDFGGFEPINGRVCDISCEKWSVLGAVPTSISSTQTYLSGSSWVAASGATATNESGATTLFESGAILEFEEQASLTAPAATFGRLWVRDDTPNTLVYTDDAGTVHSCIEPDTQSIVTATSTELLDIADAINTGADKVAGYQVFNTTTTAPVWAVGDTDGAVWVDATGTTAHTPV